MTTKIEWTDRVWNPVTGCQKISDGCRYCYAETAFHRQANGFKTPAYAGRQFKDVAVHPERLAVPLRRKKPTVYFVNSMSDLFEVSVPDGFIDQVFAVMALAHWHRFIVLTKRPQRMAEYMAFERSGRSQGFPWRQTRETMVRAAQTPLCPPLVRGDLGGENGSDKSPRPPFPKGEAREWPLKNVVLGVSVENQPTADERIPYLLETPAACRAVSYEPALGPVDWDDYFEGFPDENTNATIPPIFIDWLIACGESGPKARPAHPDWFRQTRDQCQEAGVPFFFKQWGEYGPNIPLGYKLSFDRPIPSGYEFKTIQGQERAIMYRLGKKNAGRELDGREWNEVPGTLNLTTDEHR